MTKNLAPSRTRSSPPDLPKETGPGGNRAGGKAGSEGYQGGGGARWQTNGATTRPFHKAKKPARSSRAGKGEIAAARGIWAQWAATKAS